jgi:hypothetical protein
MQEVQHELGCELQRAPSFRASSTCTTAAIAGVTAIATSYHAVFGSGFAHAANVVRHRRHQQTANYVTYKQAQLPSLPKA